MRGDTRAFIAKTWGGDEPLRVAQAASWLHALRTFLPCADVGVAAAKNDAAVGSTSSKSAASGKLLTTHAPIYYSQSNTEDTTLPSMPKYEDRCCGL